MEAIVKLNKIINEFVWGPPMLILLVGTGIYLTFRTNAFSILRLGYVLKNTLLKIFSKKRLTKQYLFLVSFIYPIKNLLRV